VKKAKILKKEIRERDSLSLEERRQKPRDLKEKNSSRKVESGGEELESGCRTSTVKWLREAGRRKLFSLIVWRKSWQGSKDKKGFIAQRGQGEQGKGKRQL